MLSGSSSDEAEPTDQDRSGDFWSDIWPGNFDHVIAVLESCQVVEKRFDQERPPLHPPEPSLLDEGGHEAQLTPDCVVGLQKCRTSHCIYAANPKVAGDYCCGCCKGWDEGYAQDNWKDHGKQCERVCSHIPSTPVPEWAMQTVREMHTNRSLEMQLENEEFRELCRSLTDDEFEECGGALHTDEEIAVARGATDPSPVDDDWEEVGLFIGPEDERDDPRMIYWRRPPLVSDVEPHTP